MCREDWIWQWTSKSGEMKRKKKNQREKKNGRDTRALFIYFHLMMATIYIHTYTYMEDYIYWHVDHQSEFDIFLRQHQTHMHKRMKKKRTPTINTQRALWRIFTAILFSSACCRSCTFSSIYLFTQTQILI